ncbi:VOC family protein [Chromobacterium vaccinii]|uniref:VOC family protein n=1 Tax=Chromobacterium vaccinii TaxID=1108595 RepID=UPI000617D021|nr:VOC family protein [Chromobacterium vaccinii]QND82506.1 Biphenyl-2,3-diol 1,2-dioxygenase [Chromobacterium vaccinii]QND87736.1 Biphenyl-2,3-diol 1,2-dioxygenase [Chromobacterium vaccinii]SUX29645.1 Virulence protein STM3117 [Chromobacterium vaccinii]
MISHIDHIVLTVRDIEAAAAFYQRALKLEAVTFGNGRRALRFGNQKINLQSLGQETRNHAAIGSGDLCLIAAIPLPEVIENLKREGVAIVEGPITRSGAMGPITSVYFNDPDGNLVEVSSYSF